MLQMKGKWAATLQWGERSSEGHGKEPSYVHVRCKLETSLRSHIFPCSRCWHANCALHTLPVLADVPLTWSLVWLLQHNARTNMKAVQRQLGWHRTISTGRFSDHGSPGQQSDMLIMCWLRVNACLLKNANAYMQQFTDSCCTGW